MSLPAPSRIPISENLPQGEVRRTPLPRTLLNSPYATHGRPTIGRGTALGDRVYRRTRPGARGDPGCLIGYSSPFDAPFAPARQGVDQGAVLRADREMARAGQLA